MMMKFTKWVKMATTYTWKELQLQGTTKQQRYRLYDEFEEYCKEHDLTPKYDFD